MTPEERSVSALLLNQVAAWRQMNAFCDASRAAYQDCAFTLEAIVKYDLAKALAPPAAPPAGEGLDWPDKLGVWYCDSHHEFLFTTTEGPRTFFKVRTLEGRDWLGRDDRFAPKGKWTFCTVTPAVPQPEAEEERPAMPILHATWRDSMNNRLTHSDRFIRWPPTGEWSPLSRTGCISCDKKSSDFIEVDRTVSDHAAIEIYDREVRKGK